METEEITEPTGVAPRMSKRQFAQQAIALAMQSHWQEAADANLHIVRMAPDDAEAYNRLGKAYTELGKISDARDAYEKALVADPANLIAQRNLDRLSRISDDEAAEITRKAGFKLDPSFFMEETGKTGIAMLQSPAGADSLATLMAGDRLDLQAQDRQLLVTTSDGTHLGPVEAKLATRLTRLMKAGNEYQAGVVGVDGDHVRIIMRETVQAPKNAGKISFPPRTASEALPRPYLKEGRARRGSDDDEEDDGDVETADGELEEEEEDASEFGFREGRLDES
jgi:tetratricopeptide (TPR) repeat protein